MATRFLRFMLAAVLSDMGGTIPKCIPCRKCIRNNGC
jgi:hypothetical protein